MEMITDSFGRNTGILLGRSLHHLNAIIVLVVMPVLLLLLSVYVLGRTISTGMDILEDIFFADINKKRKK